LRDKLHPEILTGIPQPGEVRKKTIFWLFCVNISKTVEIRPLLELSASPAELWSSVNGKQKTYNRIEINGVQLNADFINMFLLILQMILIMML